LNGIIITVIAVGYWGNLDMLNEKHATIELGDRIRKTLEEVAKFI